MLQYFRILVDGRRAAMDERGASAVEYGLLVIGIAVAVIAAVAVFTGVLDGLFDRTTDCVDGNSSTACANQ